MAFAASLSAFWILAANSWMQTPSGGHIENGLFVVDNYLAAIFSPDLPLAFSHMPLFLLDAQGRVANCNKVALALTGHRSPTGTLTYAAAEDGLGSDGHEVLGQDLATLLPWIAPALDCADPGCSREGGVCRERELTLDGQCHM